MGQQLNKVIKRRRRKAYLARKKARTKAGIANNSSGRVKRLAATAAAEGVKVAKKVAAKKAPAAKKAAKPKKEDAAAVEAAPAEETAPAAEA